MKFFGFLVTLLSLSHSIDSNIIKDEPKTSENSQLLLQKLQDSSNSAAVDRSHLVEATKEHFSFVVIVKVVTKTNERSWCSGALIREDFVLTSAGCVSGAVNIRPRVIIGRTILESNDDKERTITIIDIIPHHLFTVGDTKYDIALLQLNEKVSTNEYVGITNQIQSSGSACDNEPIQVVGYHRMYRDRTVLDWFNIQIMDDTENNHKCRKMLQESNSHDVLHGSELCISSDIKRQVDSTDVLVQKQCGKNMLLGIVTNRRFIVTRVAYHIDWINKNT